MRVVMLPLTDDEGPIEIDPIRKSMWKIAAMLERGRKLQSQPAEPPKETQPMNAPIIRTGSANRKPIILLYGEQKIGKTTFASKSNKPIFTGPENGAPHLKDVARMETPLSWNQYISQIEWLLTADHPYQTLVVDTLDWLEPLLWGQICNDHGKKHIEDFGYGRGYEYAIDAWRKFITLLEKINERKGMTIILLAHAWNRTVNNAEGADYERVELKFHKKAWPLFVELADIICFASRPVAIDKNEGKAKGSGPRVLRTGNTPALVTGSRWSIPETMPLEWSALKQALANAGAFGGIGALTKPETTETTEPVEKAGEKESQNAE